MTTVIRLLNCVIYLLALIFVLSCSGSDDPEPELPTPNNGSPRFTGNLTALFVGHSAMNEVIEAYVETLAQLKRAETTLDATAVTNYEGENAHPRFSGLSLGGKINYENVRPIFEGDNSYDFMVITEEWDHQNYNVDYHGIDENESPAGCPTGDYPLPANWTNPEFDWYFTPYYVQQYRDALTCGNIDAMTFYYQTWSLGWNEVTNGDTRESSQNYTRPTYNEIAEDIRNGSNYPDLPLADRIEYEGVKWQHFVHHANRSDIVFIPAGFALARFIREIEAGTVPGFEAVAGTQGKDGNGRLVWPDYIFYEDGYHLATIGHYLMSLVIYASVFNETPEGIEVGSGNFRASWAFENDQYPIEEITNAEYQTMLADREATGIWKLRGVNGLDYMHEDLRVYLQQLAWDVVQHDSEY